MARFFAVPEMLSLDVRKLETSGDYLSAEICSALDDALCCADGLNAIGAPREGQSLSSVRKSLESQLINRLGDAADASDDAAVAHHLRLRSEAVATGDYAAAREYAATTELKVELLIGLVPSWRWPDHRQEFSAILAVKPQGAPRVVTESVDSAVEAIAQSFLAASDPNAIPTLAKLQSYSVVDLVGLAGDAARYPCHFANFLPEDEGDLGTTKKTVVYQNFYLERFKRVSAPLLDATLLAQATTRQDISLAAGPVLLEWFRAHDIAHSYSDGLCRRSGLDLPLIHCARELLADLIGFLTVANSSDQAPAILVAEMLRYARRSPALFADATAARIEYGWLLKSGGIETAISDPDVFSERITELLGLTVSHLVSGDSAYLAQWMNRLADGVPRALHLEESSPGRDVYPLLESLIADRKPNRVRQSIPTAGVRCQHS
ncbi:hypothetical protein [Streptomyces beijiangensis]|uniref:Uncharacterized protein n=1 Tax=Streptomyces beijiangensis TaxID=163361 RepID=A0A939JED2_9ACTN|nr:hypothetical protein [Streptomyces beijiangensis]MBO0512956.1 hypothetical protein [Streptomyces beijiangensis]